MTLAYEQMSYFPPYSAAASGTQHGNVLFPPPSAMGPYGAPQPVAPFATFPASFAQAPGAFSNVGYPLTTPATVQSGSAPFGQPAPPRAGGTTMLRAPPQPRPSAPPPRTSLQPSKPSDARPGPGMGHGPRAMPALRAGIVEPAASTAVPAPAAAAAVRPAVAGYKSASEGRYACAPCDRGFDAASDLAEHAASHISCHAPGCSFSAGRKAVQAHHAREHGGSAPPRLPPSLVELIPPKYRGAASVGNSEAEVAQWRAERRRHFPTAAVVAEKQAAAADRSFRGDPAAEGRQPKRVRLQNDGGRAATDGAAAVGVESAADADDDSPPEESGVTLEAAFASARRAAERGEPITGSLLVRGDAEPRRPRVVVCRSHALGRCQHGARCTFSHDPADAAAEAAEAAAAPAIPRVPAQPLLSVNAKASRPGSGVPACRWFLLGTCR